MTLYSNTAAITALTAAVGTTDTTLLVGSTSNWPTPATGQKAKGVIDAGLATVEVFSYEGVAVGQLLGVERGIDGTTASAHGIGAVVDHRVSAAFFEKVENWKRDVTDFGAVGDGATDDTAAVQAAIDVGDGEVFFPPGDYSVAGLTTPSNVTLRGVPEVSVLDASGASSGATILQVDGSEAAADNLTANAPEGQAFIDIASTASYAVKDWVIVRSDATTGSTANPKAEMRQIRSLTATRITFMAPLTDSYATADTARVAKLTMVENVTVDGMTFLGPASDATDISGIDADYVVNLSIQNCRFSRLQRRAIDLQQVAQFRVANCLIDAGRENSVPVVYGVSVINSCCDGTVTNCNFVRVRHGVIVGGSPCRSITVSACTATQCLDAGFDVHPGSGMGVAFIGNTVDGSDVDGIVLQGPNCSAIGNIVRNVGRHGIIVQQLSARPMNAIVANNLISRAGDRGINCTFDASYPLFKSVIIEGNSVEFATSMSIDCRCTQTYRVNGFKVRGNTMKDGSSHTLYFEKHDEMVCEGNHVYGVTGSRSIRVINCTDSVIANNYIKNVTGSSSNIGIEVTTGIDLEIVGNRLKTCQVGVSIDNASSNCVVMGNNARGCTTPFSFGTGLGHITQTAAGDKYNRD